MGGINDGLSGAIVTIGSGVEIPDRIPLVIVTAVDIVNENGYHIGYLNSFAPGMTRPTRAVRQISRSDAGRIIFRIPLYEDTTIAVTGFSLFDKGDQTRTLLNRLGATNEVVHSLQSIFDPFDIACRGVHPNSSDLAGTRWYRECWPTSWNPGAVTSEGGDILMTEAVTLDVTGNEWEPYEG